MWGWRSCVLVSYGYYNRLLQTWCPKTEVYSLRVSETSNQYNLAEVNRWPFFSLPHYRTTCFWSHAIRRIVALMGEKKKDKHMIGLETEMEESDLGWPESGVLAEHPSGQIQKIVGRLWAVLGEQRCRFSSTMSRKGWARLRKSPLPPRTLPDIGRLASPQCAACLMFLLSSRQLAG